MTHALRVDAVPAREVERPADVADAAPLHYAGLVTRTIAFVVDAALVDAIAAALGVAAAAVIALLHVSDDTKTVLAAVGGVLFALWAALYFIVFWSTTGQTPGNRLMRIRVTRSTGELLRPRQAIVRLVALVAAIVPLGAGVVPILFTRRRRALQDFAAQTVVTQVVADAQAAVARVPAGHSPRRA